MVQHLEGIFSESEPSHPGRGGTVQETKYMIVSDSGPTGAGRISYVDPNTTLVSFFLT